MNRSLLPARTSTARRSPGSDGDLVVLSHLRWDWVWQRPQHLMSRLARTRRVWFVEEPRPASVSAPRLVVEEAAPVTRVWLEVPEGAADFEFGSPSAQSYRGLLLDLLSDAEPPLDVWLYTPMALHLAQALAPRLLVFDVMDDLSGFADAPDGIVERHRKALAAADVVFTGGRSLYAGTVEVAGAEKTYLFPSGVEVAHYEGARHLRRDRSHPTAGYVGVLDERLDLSLLAEMARSLPDWTIRMVGPVTKIDPASLPQAPNLDYVGPRRYDDLPQVMSELDVAIMPFALNDATRSISPTKTLEYLAAGLPVISTRVPDVVADWGTVVHLANTGEEFAAGCRAVIEDCVLRRDEQLSGLQARHEWDSIAARMAEILQRAVQGRSELGASA